MMATLHHIECDEDELLEIPDRRIPIGLEHNEYATPGRKAYTLCLLHRA